MRLTRSWTGQNQKVHLVPGGPHGPATARDPRCPRGPHEILSCKHSNCCGSHSYLAETGSVCVELHPGFCLSKQQGSTLHAREHLASSSTRQKASRLTEQICGKTAEPGMLPYCIMPNETKSPVYNAKLRPCSTRSFQHFHHSETAPAVAKLVVHQMTNAGATRPREAVLVSTTEMLGHMTVCRVQDLQQNSRKASLL